MEMLRDALYIDVETVPSMFLPNTDDPWINDIMIIGIDGYSVGIGNI